MGILVSFLRGIVSLVLFAAAVTTVVIDMEFIGEKLGKYKLLRYGLIAGVVLLLFLIGFNSTCNVVIIAIDIYGVWAFFRRKKEDDLAWEERQATEEKERRATECYQKAEDIKKTDLVQARELYHEAAELGHRKAQYQYGWYCLRGIGGEKDPQQAFENLTKADEMRRNEKYDLELERDVHYALGLCYSQGAGTERNDSEAVTRLEWAAEHGSSGATVVAGNVYKRNGQKSDAERMYRTAAGQGSVMSIYEVAQICMGKEGNLDAYREALELFEAVKLADARREEACEEAIQTLKGYIAEEQQKEAKAYFEDGGKDAISLEEAKELYQDAIEEMKQTLEYKTVTDKLEKAAFGSYAPAEFLCGYFWIKGMTKTQNPFIAAEWIRRAVNQDYIEDNLVEYDWILAQDEALAARILELGKQRGSAFALYRQGADAMQKGNTEEAIAAYQKAADVGNAEACYRLAIWTAQQANGNLSEEEFKQVLGKFYTSIQGDMNPILQEIAGSDDYLDVAVVRDVLVSCYNLKVFDYPKSARLAELVEVLEKGEELEGELTPEKYRELKDFAGKLKYKDFSEAYLGRLERRAKLMEGRPAIDLDLVASEGKKGKLSDYKGKPMYVDFWATWCGPCMGEMPYFNELSSKYPNVQFIGISVDESEKAWKNFIGRGSHGAVNELNCQDSRTKSGWDITGIPRFLLIDEHFNIISADAPRPSQKEIIEPILKKLSKK